MADILNCKRLLNKLSDINENLLDELERVMISSVQVVSTDARELCPVDTGQLKKSINYKVDKSSNKVTGEVGTQGVHYAPYIEFGTYKMKAKPYLTPAFKIRKIEVGENLAKAFIRVARTAKI